MMNLENLVSSETITKFNIYKDMLKEWNNKTLLVQLDTLNDFTVRHVIDSLQIIPLILDVGSPSNNLEKAIQQKNKVSILDIGSGAGFPGMVLAMCGFLNITLCESNSKKMYFFRRACQKNKYSCYHCQFKG